MGTALAHHRAFLAEHPSEIARGQGRRVVSESETEASLANRTRRKLITGHLKRPQRDG